MAKKVAISMPDPMFREMEQIRRRAKKRRSAWIQEAVAERLRRMRHDADVAAYIRSYDEQPETEEERQFVEAALKLGPVYDDEWPEAPR